MKTIPAKQSFKKVSAKQVETFPVLADRLGKQRPAVEFPLPEYEAADLPALAESNAAVLLACLNNATAQLAKDLFASNQSDWAFVPSLEMLNIDALKASFESVSRGRVLTLENAGKLATWVSMNLKAIVAGIQKIDPEYKPEQLQAMVGVITKFTAYEGKPVTFQQMVINRLTQISCAIAEDESLAESFIADSSLMDIMDALGRKFTKAAEQDEITEDAL
ncbi:hypothetical protein D3C80_129000 [compost metagenome]